jgi:uncharacterized protein (TIGR00255 family)
MTTPTTRNLRSMTGFGIAEQANNRFTLKAEIKTLNGKFFDAFIRLPKAFKNKETEVRSWAAKCFGRGTIHIVVSADLLNQEASEEGLFLNTPLALNYKRDLDGFCKQLNLQPNDMFQYLLSLPDVCAVKEMELTDSDHALLMETLSSAFDALDTFRCDEGEALKHVLEKHLSVIRQHLEHVRSLEPERKKDKTDKLKNAISEMAQKVENDPTRFEYELLYYLEKLDIQEETNRLEQHIQFFYDTLNHDASGKKLGFIAQEMGREINTMGSKANFFPIQKEVVFMKEELEKIKEQVLNVL